MKEKKEASFQQVPYFPKCKQWISMAHFEIWKTRITDVLVKQLDPPGKDQIREEFCCNRDGKIVHTIFLLAYISCKSSTP